MEYSNYVSQYSQKLQTLAYVEKKYKTKKKKKKKRHKEIPTKQLKANFYTPIKSPGNKVLLLDLTSLGTWSK